MHPHPSPAGARGHLPSPGRRLLLLGAGSVAMALALSACGSLAPPIETRPPIVFVHGNGDSAALWLTTLWRFESQGWPRDRLDAIDLPYPRHYTVKTTPRFSELKAVVTEDIRAESLKTAQMER